MKSRRKHGVKPNDVGAKIGKGAQSRISEEIPQMFIIGIFSRKQDTTSIQFDTEEVMYDDGQRKGVASGEAQVGGSADEREGQGTEWAK